MSEEEKDSPENPLPPKWPRSIGSHPSYRDHSQGPAEPKTENPPPAPENVVDIAEFKKHQKSDLSPEDIADLRNEVYKTNEDKYGELVNGYEKLLNRLNLFLEPPTPEAMELRDKLGEAHETIENTRAEFIRRIHQFGYGKTAEQRLNGIKQDLWLNFSILSKRLEDYGRGIGQLKPSNKPEQN